MIYTMYPTSHRVDLAAKAKALLAEKKQTGAVWGKHNSNVVYFDTDIPREDIEKYMGDSLSLMSEVINLNHKAPERV